MPAVALIFSSFYVAALATHLPAVTAILVIAQGADGRVSCNGDMHDQLRGQALG